MGLLNLGSSALSAQNSQVATATNNTANVNTEGYSRQTTALNSITSSQLNGGVVAGSTTRYASELLDTRIRGNAGSLAQSTQAQAALSDLEDTLTSGNTIDVQYANLFSKISTASADPSDTVARDAVVQAARDLTSAFNTAANEISDAQNQADLRIKDNVPAASSLAQQLADANKLVSQTNDPTALDKRDQLAKQLAEMTGGSARINPNGQMTFTLDNGAVLVDGTRASKLTTSADPTTGFTNIQVVDGGSVRDVTSTLGGKISADVAFRDGTAANAAASLDRLAYNTATAVNGVTQANAALDGSTGHSMFTPPFVVKGAAAALAIDATLNASSKNLALGSPGAGPGDNGGAQALYALADAKISDGMSVSDHANGIIADIGTAGNTAKNDMQRDQTVADNLSGLRDSLSGVDSEEELTNLSRFEHASSAITKFISTVDDMLTNIIQNL
ncbi:MAG: flagellar hook-associated protein FlgK [Kofleriaceae bacterium]